MEIHPKPVPFLREGEGPRPKPDFVARKEALDRTIGDFAELTSLYGEWLLKHGHRVDWIELGRSLYAILDDADSLKSDEATKKFLGTIEAILKRSR